MGNIKVISKQVFDYMGITLGCMCMALGFNSFSVPNKIAPGGFSGLATVVYHITGFPVGIITLVFTLPLFFISIKILGSKFGIKTLYGTLLFSISVDFIIKTGSFTNDMFLASVFGGILIGVGLGVVFRFGGSTGGTDLLAALLHKYFSQFSVGTWLLVIDFIVVLIASFTFKQIEIGLYSVLTIYITMKMVDLIQEGISYAKAFYIISKKPDEIAQAIIDKLDRGVTSLKGKGMYTKKERDVLFCIIHRSQITKMKGLVSSIDPEAFVILADVHEVLGEGFKNIQNK